MAELWQAVYDVIWAKSFWLPSNITWEDFKNKEDGIYHPQTSDLLVPVFLSFVVYFVRYLFERLLFAPVGHSFGLKNAVKKVTPHPALETSFKQKKSPSNEVIQTLSKQTDLSIRQVERWFRIRRNQDRTPIFKKFLESMWRCFFYFVIFWYGVYLHLDKPWFYDTTNVWSGWPHQHVSDDVYWYYMVEGAFYISLLLSMFTDNKRKDFTQMVIHHVATLLLMTLSWISNFVRIGTLVLLVHDAVDSWMEAGKVAKYIGYDKACEILFFIFMVVWVITRMIIFPFRIIRSTLFEATDGLNDQNIGWFTMYSVFNFLLCTLQVLHIIWFYYICLIASDAFRGQVQKDSRSSLESASESEGGKSQDGKEKENNISHGSSEKESTVNPLNGVIRARPKKAS